MPKLVLLWFSAGFLAGIIAASQFSFPLPWFLLILPLILLLLGIFNHRSPLFKTFPFIALLLTFVWLGAQTYTLKVRSSLQPSHDIDTSQSSLVVKGIVVEPTVDSHGSSETVLELQAYQEADDSWQAAQGRITVRLPEVFDFPYHATLTLQGQLIPALDDTTKPHASWLLRNGIQFEMFYPRVIAEVAPQDISLMGVLYRLRSTSHTVLQSIMPFPECELLSGILLGIESRIPDYLVDAYRVTGTAHIIAISGFNISLITNLISKFFNRIFPYGVGALLSILTVGIYTLFVGAQPAVLRAAIMGIIAIPAYLLGRKVIGIHSLALTAAIMAAANPFILWDVSFQLSFCATFGILMFSDYFAQHGKVLLEKSHLPSPEVLHGFFRDYLFTTLAAQLATFPVMVTYFDGFSIFSPLVNMLILPLQPVIMVMGGIALLVGLFFLPLGQILGLLTWFVVAFNDQVVLLFSLFSISLFIDKTWGFWISVALNLGMLILVFRHRQNHKAPEDQSLSAI